jgi:hypothetical protein
LELTRSNVSNRSLTKALEVVESADSGIPNSLDRLSTVVARACGRTMLAHLYR